MILSFPKLVFHRIIASCCMKSTICCPTWMMAKMTKPTYTIKPLGWESTHEITDSKTPLGRYEIFDYVEGNHTAFFYFGGSNYGYKLIRGKGYSLEAAKQACAEHWEGMIRQALEEV